MLSVRQFGRAGMSEQVPWHRMFGLAWMDFLRDRPAKVEMEFDLSVQQQRLDVLIIRKEGELVMQLPDGFSPLAAHNLISFKSHTDKLDGWALNELVGHYAAYRKLASPSTEELLPEGDFRLFAVCVRFPRELAGQVRLTEVAAGVYEVPHFTGVIRIIVVHQLPQVEQNAMLHLFSAKGELIRYGAEHYRIRSEETSSLLERLLERYLEEETDMPDALEEFTRQTIDNLLKKLPLKKRLEGASARDILATLGPEEFEEFARAVEEERTKRGEEKKPEQ
jgi:hypothetical protein